MSGTLYVVATPIGNLEDITFRAVRILREVAVIAAEDTRRTARLLQHYSISTPTTSLHEHNERARSSSIVKRLQGGESVALVSDAGTPVVSDPGAWLVAAAHQAAVPVVPVPGPSAVIAALSASGLTGDQFLFVGFPPSRSEARKRWLGELKDEPRLLAFYEAPHRIRQSLEDLLNVLGDRLIAVGRELTKAHEELVVRHISVVLAGLREPRGEYTVIVSPAVREESSAGAPDAETLAREFGDLTNTMPGSRREVIRELARRHGLSPRQVYQLIESATGG